MSDFQGTPQKRRNRSGKVHFGTVVEQKFEQTKQFSNLMEKIIHLVTFDILRDPRTCGYCLPITYSIELFFNLGVHKTSVKENPETPHWNSL